MYKVIRFFTDLQDNGYPYNEGDIFPRDGLSVSKERLVELSSTNNKQRERLIELVVDEGKLTKTEINRMPVSDLRKMASDSGVENAEAMTGSELKTYLIHLMGL